MGTAAPPGEKLDTVLMDRAELPSAVHREDKWGSRGRTLTKECPFVY